MVRCGCAKHRKRKSRSRGRKRRGGGCRKRKDKITRNAFFNYMRVFRSHNSGRNLTQRGAICWNRLSLKARAPFCRLACIAPKMRRGCSRVRRKSRKSRRKKSKCGGHGRRRTSSRRKRRKRSKGGGCSRHKRHRSKSKRSKKRKRDKCWVPTGRMCSRIRESVWDSDCRSSASRPNCIVQAKTNLDVSCV